MELLYDSYKRMKKVWALWSKFLFIAEHFNTKLKMKWSQSNVRIKTETSHIPILIHLSHLLKTEGRLKLRFVSFRKVWRRAAGLSFSRPPAPGGRRRRRTIEKECVIFLMMKGGKKDQLQRKVRRKVVVWRSSLHSPLTSWSSLAILEKEIWRLQEENEKKEKTIIELRVGEERRKTLERELNMHQEEVIHLRKNLVLLEQKLQQLSGIKQNFNPC